MKKNLLFIFFLIFSAVTSHAAAQGDIRVKCSNFTMNVISDNTRCYQVLENNPVSFEAGPEEIVKAQIANIAIFFSDLENLNNSIEPQVTFYLIDDLMKTSIALVDPVMNLRDILENITAGDMPIDSITTPVPFLPYQTEQQVTAKLLKLINFENGSGLRSVIAFQDPISSNQGASNLYYSWQGLSTDGKYYISAVFPLTSTTLDGKSPNSVDWNSLNSKDFQLSLEQLDYYIRSIVIE